MRTRSEWFLGDGGCGADGQHGQATCECLAAIRKNSAQRGPRKSPSADEMDGHHHRSSGTPQLFESSVDLPTDPAQRLDGADALQCASNTFGTLPITACPCACPSSRLHSLGRGHVRASEAGNGHLPRVPVLGGNGKRFNCTADTHDAPLCVLSVPYAPHTTKKGARHATDGNNNINRLARSHDNLDEIRVFSGTGGEEHSMRASRAGAAEQGVQHGTYAQSHSHERTNAYCTRSEEGLGPPFLPRRPPNRRSRSRPSSTGDTVSDSKIMILFKILDLIF